MDRLIQKCCISIIIMQFLMLGLCIVNMGDNAIAEEGISEEYLEDYEQFWDIIKNSSPFYSNILELYDVHSIYLDGRRTVQQRVTSSEGLLLTLKGVCSQLGNFAHLQVIDAPYYYRLVSRGENLFNGTDYRYSMVNNEVTRNFYSSIYRKESEQKSTCANFPSVYYPEQKTLCYNIASFYYEEALNPTYSGIVDMLENCNDEIMNVVFDIRGNRGGYDSGWRYIVSQFTENVEWNRVAYCVDTSDSRQFLDQVFLTYAPINRLDALYPKVIETNVDLLCTFYSEVFPLETYAGNQYKEKVQRWVIMDEKCYSAADEFVEFCIETGWATVVGKQATRGDGLSFLGARWFRLTNSGILFQMSMGAAINSDGSLNVLNGSSGYLLCPPRIDELTYVLNLISKSLAS